jgi:hypothetical protein
MKWTVTDRFPMQWTDWFAWYPVRLEDDDGNETAVSVWLEVVERRWIAGYGGLTCIYRAKNADR